MRFHWLPPALDFRNDLREATASPDRVERLRALAEHDLSFLETIQVDRALGTVTEGAGFSGVRVAILSSATVDHLAPAIRVAGLRRRLLIDVNVGQFGQYRQELLDAGDRLRKLQPHFLLLSLSARDFVGTASPAATSEEADGIVARALDDLRQLWGKARELTGASIIQQTFLNVAEPLFGSYDRVVPGAPARMVSRLNTRMADLAAAEGVLLLDIAAASDRDGLGAWFDVSRWLQGKLEIAPSAAPMYGELAARVVGAQRGLSRKCLVLDLDNTLWGGVIGDDGLAGLVLGEGTATGEAHLAVQRYAKQLRERGVILAVCSKNDLAIAEGAFLNHPEMLLKRSDIAAFVANWDDKAINLPRIAAQLNIGIDSLVFLDDNPAERARIRQALPMVAVPELPPDAAQYVHCLADAGYFEAVAFTSEDRQRGDQYAANLLRDEAQQSAESMEDFHRSLGMSLAYGPITPVDLARATQLIGKTNQFNPTTRRYSAEEVARFAEDSRGITLQFRLVDRFGDNGLVSVMILTPDPADAGTLDLVSWVMSCRVFGRQLEAEAMNIAVEAARALGASALQADYLPTAKNAVVEHLYPNLGFVPAPGQPDIAGGTRWRLLLAAYVAHPTHISRSKP
jgi:FkbH-like protein